MKSSKVFSGALVEEIDDSLKKGIGDIQIKTAEIDALINPLAQAIAQKVPTISAQKTAEEIAGKLKKVFTDPIMINIGQRLHTVYSLLETGAASAAKFEPEKKRNLAREELEKINDNYLQKIREMQRFMQRYDGIFRDFLEISPEKPTRAKEPAEFKRYIAAYAELEKEMRLTRDALTLGGEKSWRYHYLKRRRKRI